MSFRPFNRRDFIAGVGATAATLPSFSRAAMAVDPASVFAWGVASGDPLSDRVILWTRVSPSLGASVAVLWDVALDAGFTQMVRRGRALASAASDHTVKVDVLGLPANNQLYYRFIAGGQTSTIGKTRTLPVGQVDEVKLAVFSCSNYPAGYFNASLTSSWRCSPARTTPPVTSTPTPRRPSSAASTRPCTLATTSTSTPAVVTPRKTRPR